VRDVQVGGLRVFASPATPQFYGAYQLDGRHAAADHWAKVRQHTVTPRCTLLVHLYCVVTVALLVCSLDVYS
jgi:hypothetical protein